jgi:hypothetical protein
MVSGILGNDLLVSYKLFRRTLYASLDFSQWPVPKLVELIYNTGATK